MPWLERTELLLGSENVEKLQNANVLVVGVGGVGAYAAEMIARAGVGKMTLADAARGAFLGAGDDDTCRIPRSFRRGLSRLCGFGFAG